MKLYQAPAWKYLLEVVAARVPRCTCKKSKHCRESSAHERQDVAGGTARAPGRASQHGRAHRRRHGKPAENSSHAAFTISAAAVMNPFIVVNCAAIPESLLEAELFGFTRGAFTGAVQSRLGRIHAAHGGTLLLDEVGELPLSMQAKLLRFVQEGEVQRLGSSDLFRVDARLIAATNADLLHRVREKQFREDLYYRLAVFPINLPPLRDRFEDILPLAQHFLKALALDANIPPKTFSVEAAAVLQKYSWPGNVRELQHSVERAFVMAEGNEQIRSVDLSMFPDAT